MIRTLHKNKARKSKGILDGTCNLYRVVRDDFSDKVRFKHITEGGIGVSLGSKKQQEHGLSGRSVPGLFLGQQEGHCG